MDVEAQDSPDHRIQCKGYGLIAVTCSWGEQRPRGKTKQRVRQKEGIGQSKPQPDEQQIRKQT